MPVKTRKPTKRRRMDARRNRSSVRSRESRSSHTALSTRVETPTISAFKRAMARSHSTVLRSVYEVPTAIKQTAPLSTLLPSNPRVTINPDAWYRLLAHNPDLCYLSLSGQFHRKDGYYLKSGSDSISIAGAFRTVSPGDNFTGKCVVSSGQRIAFSPNFLDSQTQAVFTGAVQIGKSLFTNLTVEHYLSLFGPNGSASPMDYGFPNGSSFSQAIAYILTNNNIDPQTFMERSHLDRNIYNKLKRAVQYNPEPLTCKAILFAVRPTILQAITLYGLAKHHFANTQDDLLLLAFFAISDYNIDKYNELMALSGYPQLGSKNYNVRRRKPRK